MTRKKLFDLIKIIVVGLVVYGWYRLTPYMDPYIVRDWVHSYGNLSPAIYILAWAILPIFLFPVPALVLPGGMLFGFVEGSLYTLIGVFLNASIMFYMTRHMAKDLVSGLIYSKLSPEYQQKLRLHDQKSLWIFFAILRFLPVISYNLINYAAGLTELKYRNHITSTIIGVLPGTIAYINIGDKLMDPTSPDFILSLVFMGVIILISLIVAKKYMPEGEEDSPYGQSDHNSTDL